MHPEWIYLNRSNHCNCHEILIIFFLIFCFVYWSSSFSFFFSSFPRPNEGDPVTIFNFLLCIVITTTATHIINMRHVLPLILRVTMLQIIFKETAWTTFRSQRIKSGNELSRLILVCMCSWQNALQSISVKSGHHREIRSPQRKISEKAKTKRKRFFVRWQSAYIEHKLIERFASAQIVCKCN